MKNRVGWPLGIIMVAASLFAQERIHITRLALPVTFDGRVDEEAWEAVEPLPLVMHAPVFGGTPTEKTEVFVAFDETYLYLAGRLYQKDPSTIRSTSKKRDFMGPNSDWFGIILDTFNDKENGLAFFTTPAGLRLDLTVFNDAVGEFPMNISWNTFWDVETCRNDEGWFVEMRIPFSSLRFQQTNGCTVMGLIIWRYLAGTAEQIIWPAIPPEWGMWSIWKVSQAGEARFVDIQKKNPLYVTPYLLGGFERGYDLNDEETAYAKREEEILEAGLDLKVGLTSNLTMDITLNTDFSQVEADDQQVKLTRFSRPRRKVFGQYPRGALNWIASDHASVPIV